MEIAHQQRQSQITSILNRLDEREQQIIIRRFGLDHSHEPLTLKEVGEVMGVTKERIPPTRSSSPQQAARSSHD